MRSVITGTGMYIPPSTVDNHALARVMDTSDEWIQVRTGIAERHYASPDQASSDLAVPAARQAISSASSVSRRCRASTSASNAPVSSMPCSLPTP
jgi:3-oxoacyl-[acyl-carrier-protein] synthase-3